MKLSLVDYGILGAPFCSIRTYGFEGQKIKNMLKIFESFADFKTCHFFQEIAPKYSKSTENLKNIFKKIFRLKVRKVKNIRRHQKVFDVFVKTTKKQKNKKNV